MIVPLHILQDVKTSPPSSQSVLSPSNCWINIGHSCFGEFAVKLGCALSRGSGCQPTWRFIEGWSLQRTCAKKAPNKTTKVGFDMAKGMTCWECSRSNSSSLPIDKICQFCYYFKHSKNEPLRMVIGGPLESTVKRGVRIAIPVPHSAVNSNMVPVLLLLTAQKDKPNSPTNNHTLTSLICFTIGGSKGLISLMF